ncbi:MAG: transposase [Oxalobacter sp.]|nr:transposase [Oxalobacter sp.]
MKIETAYKVKIMEAHGAFTDTVDVYRQAVDFLIPVVLAEWEQIKAIKDEHRKMMFVQGIVHHSKARPKPKYDFDTPFYKFPSYLRRAAINATIGKVASYKSNYAKWEVGRKKKEPGLPRAGYANPAMYRSNCFKRTGPYTAKVKVWIRNTWDWLDVELRKSDVDYIQRHCANRKEKVPTLKKRGKNWYLDFSFEEEVKLKTKPVGQQVIIGVDLGINNACACSAMRPDGTVLGREIQSQPVEKDSLGHALNKIKKAQQHGARKIPRLWARAKGINLDIAHKTALFIIDFALRYNADVIVFEYLNLKGRKKGAKKQKLHHWRAQAVQRIVADKAHRAGIRFSRVVAKGTSALAFDGSGEVERDRDNYSMCTFASGKRYHSDLSASYNIAARYFVREILKSLPEKARLGIEAKVPECTKRTTCTLSTLFSLNAELAAAKSAGHLSSVHYRGKALHLPKGGIR